MGIDTLTGEIMDVDITKELPTVISFCSGYGGIERGLDLAGVEHRVIAYVEIEAFAIANLVAKMEAGQLVPAPIFTDLKTFPSHLFRDCVDIITGGYPCQPFSAAGKRQGEDDPRHLWPYIRKHVSAIRPTRCFFENVEGHITLGLSSVISDLEEGGYRATWGIFSASESGAPHRRKRVFIMADTGSAGLQGQERRWTAGEERESFGHFTKRGGELSNSNGRGQEQSWPPEPRLGRVVDGCADRVDRIRLLGNGVVPQTAAKAWTTLLNRSRL